MKKKKLPIGKIVDGELHFLIPDGSKIVFTTIESRKIKGTTKSMLPKYYNNYSE